jgi:hypothetical protein
VTWFKVDDGFWSHPKSVDLTPEAVALWVRAGSYCGKHLTDGFVPAGRLGMLQGTPEAAYELVVAGLWTEVPDGWQFHEWDRYQDTKDVVERRRESWKARQAKRRSENDDTSSLSIPFHSIHSRDSTRESRRDTPRDIDPPADPTLVAETVADIRAQLRRNA